MALCLLDIHFVDGGPLTAQYLLVVDALNFCFWEGKPKCIWVT